MISPKHPRISRSKSGLAIIFTVFLLQQMSAAEAVGQAKYIQRLTAEYQQEKASYQSGTNGSAAGWEFARACYNLADVATNDETRAGLAVEGIEACRKLIKDQPKSGPGHYYLGMNLGQLARTELLGALALVREMEKEFKTAWSLDTSVDYGGPARSLGLLYRDAPGWPASIGSSRKSREWLDKAARAGPEFPENWMILAESYLQWNETETAREQLKQLARIWPAAQTNFTGVVWEHDWADWTARRNEAENKIKEQEAPAVSARKNR